MHELEAEDYVRLFCGYISKVEGCIYSKQNLELKGDITY